MRTAKLIAAILLSFGLLFSAGFELNEHGAKAVAMGSAFIAQANDPSAIYYNPAGIAFLDGAAFYLGGTMIAVKGDFTGADPYPGAGVKEEMEPQTFLLPAMYFTYRICDRIAAGIGVFSPFGLSTKWKNPDRFTGRFISIDSGIEMVTISPALAFKLSDNLSVGAGLLYSISKLSLNRHLPPVPIIVNGVYYGDFEIAKLKYESDYSSSVSFSLGLLWKASDKLSLGLSYRHGHKADYTGKLEMEQIPTGIQTLDLAIKMSPLFNTPTTIDTSIKYPASLGAGIAYRATDKLVLELDVNYTLWSQYKEIPIDFTPDILPDTVMEQYYEDSLTLRVGGEYAVSDTLALRAGYVYDAAAAKPESVDPILPDTTRHLFSVGVGYKLGGIYVDLYGIYLLGEDRSTEGKSVVMYEGTYSTSALLFGLNVGFRF